MLSFVESFDGLHLGFDSIHVPLAGPSLRRRPRVFFRTVPIDGELLKQSSATGQPLPRECREQLEKELGADFSDVRICQGPSARSVGAVAFAVGSEIHFAPGKYDPQSDTGRRLIAHELTHVIQQREGRVAPLAKGLVEIE